MHLDRRQPRIIGAKRLDHLGVQRGELERPVADLEVGGRHQILQPKHRTDAVIGPVSAANRDHPMVGPGPQAQRLGRARGVVARGQPDQRVGKA